MHFQKYFLHRVICQYLIWEYINWLQKKKKKNKHENNENGVDFISFPTTNCSGRKPVGTWICPLASEIFLGTCFLMWMEIQCKELCQGLQTGGVYSGAEEAQGRPYCSL